MASTNQSPQYQKAEVKFLAAKTNEEKLICLEEMIRECPKHKSSEKMLANLKTRHIKLKEKMERQVKTKKGAAKKGIKKEDMQAVIVGFANSGKSSLLSALTNARSNISEYQFSTKSPMVGMMGFQGVGIQLVDVPAVDSEYYDRGLVNTADTLIIVVTNLKQINEMEKIVERSYGKRIIVMNVADMFLDAEKRKIFANLQSKKYNFEIISSKTGENINNLKEKIFKSFDKMRVYTKEPGKEKSNKPIILNQKSTVKDVAEKILHGFSKKVKETKIWGPSSKFSGQKVGISHELKDGDIVEFKTR